MMRLWAILLGAGTALAAGIGTASAADYQDPYCGESCSAVGPLQYVMGFDAGAAPQMTVAEARQAVVDSVQRMKDGLVVRRISSQGITASRPDEAGAPGFFPFGDYGYLAVRLQKSSGTYYLAHQSWAKGGPFGGWAGGEWSDLADGKRFVQAFAALRYYEKNPPAGQSLADYVPAAADKPNYSRGQDPESFAVVAGIETYAVLPEARFALRDAEAVRDHLLALGTPAGNILLLENQKATRAGLAQALDSWLPERVGKGSTVFFYYSGRGASDPKSGLAYLLGADGAPDDLAGTGTRLKDLYKKLDRLKAKRVIVALESGFPGADKVSLGAIASAKLLSLLAARDGQGSGAVEEQGHGALTAALLQGLNGAALDKNGQVTLQGLFDYLAPQVAQAARLQKREQTPQLLSADGAAATVLLR